LSKEFLRQIYAPTSWYQAVGKAKDIAKERGTNNWKEICANELGEKPQVLNNEQVNVATMLYTSLANEMAWALGKAAPFEKEASLKNWRQQCASWL
jgi:phosphoribosylaminoimidazole-succinocarboxamide synthase